MADEPPASRPTSAVPSSTASNDNFQEATATAAGEETATTGSTTASKAEAEVDEGDAGASKEAQEDEKAPEVPPKRLSLAHEPENAPPTPPIMVKNLDEDTTSPLHTAAESKPRASLEVPVPGRHSSKGRDDDESGRRSRRSTDPEGMLVETLRGQIDELHNQVTQLNSKLVKSYDRIAGLEDELHVTKEELDATSKRNKALDLEAAQHAEALRGGILVESADVQSELQRLTQRLLTESAARTESEASLSSFRAELDDLSASLFSEANKMVASEKLARIKAERKQMDAEEAMKGVQEAMGGMRAQLGGLGGQLEQAEKERDDWREKWFQATGGIEHTDRLAEHEAGGGASIVFSDGVNVVTTSPNLALASANDSSTSINSAAGRAGTPRQGAYLGSVQSHATAGRLRNDILPYGEFIGFIRHLRKTRTETLAKPIEPTYGYGHGGAYGATTGEASRYGRFGAEGQPLQSGSHASEQEKKELLASVLPLSTHLSQPFLKRCVEEDSDPALRLDIAPGLNFLSRRTVLTSIVEGHLVIEPVWGDPFGIESDKCTLCGTGLDRWLANANGGGGTRTPTTTQTVRKMLNSSGWGFGNLKGKKSIASFGATSSSQTSPNVDKDTQSPPNNSTRSFSLPGSMSPSALGSGQNDLPLHTFRTNDTATTRYPLCPTYCLTRLRAVCDFWTYVRSIEKGLLLEEGFRLAPVNTSLGYGLGTGGGSGAVAGLGVGTGSASSLGLASPPPLPDRKHDDIRVASPTTAEAPTEEKASPAEDAKATEEKKEASPEEEKPSSPEESAKVIEPSAKADEASPESAATPSTATDAPTSPSAAAPPPLPKRSAARAAPALPPRSSTPTPRDHPQPGIHAPPVSSSLSAPLPPPPRRNVSVAGTRPDPPSRRGSGLPHSAVNSAVGPSGVQDALGLGPGWEDRCWTEVVRLKEEMFWRRIGAAAPA